MTFQEFVNNSRVQRWGYIVGGVSLAILTAVVPALAPASAVLYPTATLMVGKGLKAPGHGEGTEAQ